MSIQPVILAAGKGTRMGNPDLPKVLFPVAGKPMILHLLHSLASTNFLPPAIVVGYKQEMVRQVLGEGYSYIVQEEQLGTGHALKACQEKLAGKSDTLLVLYGDQPLWSVSTMERLVAKQKSIHSVLSLATLTSTEPNFEAFGRVLRTLQGSIFAIRERKDCSNTEAKITEYNPGLYCIEDSWVWSALDQILPENAQTEYYLTDLLAIAVNQGQLISSISISDWRETLGVNTPLQLKEIEQCINSQSLLL